MTATSVLSQIEPRDFNRSDPKVLVFPSMTTKEYENAFREHFSATLRFVVSLGAPSDAAEEIAQAAWVRGWERRGQIRSPGSVGAWVNSIAKNIFRNDRRKEQRVEHLSDSASDSPAPDGSPLAAIEARRILGQCRTKDRVVLSKYYLEGYSAEEIAAEIGLSSSAVRVRLLRIRQALRLRLPGGGVPRRDPAFCRRGVASNDVSTSGYNLPCAWTAAS